ncbi:hypothetical protein [Actinoplanes regularis]|uniref:hypothetical protein n=1 Tax=Actinoplanes regularis TaxID=52697 RepID=UPI0024A058E6|nr:hypothetical protein [Actinoplanes regularis]GLW31207.1 hypothetical protein Areg01_41470 [Actinoplanes regularis]
MTTDPPEAWADLIEGLTLLAQYPADESDPLHCSHDTLHVCADETAFTADEIARLDQLGFMVHRDGGFYSYRFGSA